MHWVEGSSVRSENVGRRCVEAFVRGESISIIGPFLSLRMVMDLLLRLFASSRISIRMLFVITLPL